MLVALISIQQYVRSSPSGSEAELRALLPVAGKNIALWQMEAASKLGCGRILCATHADEAVIATLQEAASLRAMEFHLVRKPMELPLLVDEHDDLLVWADGIFAHHQQMQQFLSDDAGQGGAFLIPPPLVNEDKGFVLAARAEATSSCLIERIDATHAWAGAMKIKGSIAARLLSMPFDLPDDGDLPAALMRCALQAGARLRLLPEAELARCGWSVVHDEEEAQACEQKWLEQEAKRHSPWGYTSWLASRVMVRAGALFLRKAVVPIHMDIAALALGCVAIGLAAQISLALGLIVLFMAALSAAIGLRLEQFICLSADGGSIRRRRGQIAGDVFLLTVLAVGVGMGGHSVLNLFFYPFAMLGLLWLHDIFRPDGWRMMLVDRGVICLLLAFVTMVAGAQAALQVAILALIGVAWMALRKGQQLTGA